MVKVSLNCLEQTVSGTLQGAPLLCGGRKLSNNLTLFQEKVGNVPNELSDLAK